MSNGRVIWDKLLAAGALLTAAAGCGPAVPADAQQAGPSAIEVRTATAGYGTIDRQTEFVGRVEAAESIKVYATSQAKVLQTYVAPGEYVEKGTLLFELDTENLQTMAETARPAWASSRFSSSIFNWRDWLIRSVSAKERRCSSISSLTYSR